MTNTNPEIASGGRLHLLGLPAELQSIIFDLAYQRAPGTRLIGKQEWSREFETLRYRPHDTDSAFLRPFPGVKVSEFMVSKQYFAQAAGSYVRSQPLEIGMRMLNPTIAFDSDGILTAFTLEIVGEYIFCSLWHWQSVQSLRLTVEAETVSFSEDDEEDDLPFLRRPLTAEEVSKSALAGRFDHFGGFKHIELVAQELPEFCYNDVERENFRANVKILEAVVKPRLIERKAKGCEPGEVREKTEPKLTPLYARSDVIFESPEEGAVVEAGHKAGHLDFIIWELADTTGAERSQVQEMVSGLFESGAKVREGKGPGGPTRRGMLRKTKAFRRVLESEDPICEDDIFKSSSCDEDGVPVTGEEWKSTREMALAANASMRLASRRLAAIDQRMAETEGVSGKLAVEDYELLDQLQAKCRKFSKAKVQRRMPGASKASSRGIRADWKVLAGFAVLFLVWYLCSYL